MNEVLDGKAFINRDMDLFQKVYLDGTEIYSRTRSNVK